MIGQIIHIDDVAWEIRARWENGVVLTKADIDVPTDSSEVKSISIHELEKMK